MKKLLGLGGIRFFALSIALIANLIVVKLLHLEEVGKYYLFVTVSYVGNALFFVGADLLLQKRIQPSLIEHDANFLGLVKYVVHTSAFGFVLILGLSFLYFSQFYGHEIELEKAGVYALICSAGSVALYVTSLSRNLFLLGNDALLSNLQLMFDGLIKLGLIVTGFSFFHISDGVQYFLVITLGAGIAG
ncbi:MAG: hypothetical protein EOO07_36900, partial [Chitinophagaceae bacterium]